MKYVNIGNKYLVEQLVPAAKLETAKASGSTSHLWLYDRSYSMSGDLKRLCSDLTKRAKGLPVGDNISIGWFSGQGDHNFILKGFKISSDSDWKILESAISNNSTPVGTTCFSEILFDTNQVIQDVSVLSDTFALTLLTDGYPVVSNYKKEIEDIHKSIDQIEGKVAASLLVGYGDHYNKSLMYEMAEKLNGQLIHCDLLDEFSVSLDEFIKETEQLNPKVEVELGVDTNEDALVYTIKDNSITPLHNQQGMVKVSPKKRGDLSVFILSDSVPENAEELSITEDLILRPTKKEPLIKGLYAAAFLLTQQTKVDQALEVLDTLGDVKLMDKANDAFVNSDYGKVEKSISSAVFSSKQRLLGGYETGYLPKGDSFCLLDLLKMIMKDSEAKFYPYHPSFNYKRIGAKTQYDPDYPKFNPDKEMGCSFDGLVWSSKRLNLSVRARIKGKVHLEKASDHGLASNYPTFVWRNYTLVKDGTLNVQTLPSTFSDNVSKILESLGVYEDGVLYLNRIPVMNRVIANGRTSAKELFKNVIQEEKLKAQLKVYKFYRDETGEQSSPAYLSPETQEYLDSSGFRKDGSYNPPKVAGDAPEDFYYAKEFSIKVKGISSLPKVSDVEKRISEGKKQTTAGALMENAVVDARDKEASYLEQRIAELNKELFAIRHYIQETKFAIVLGKKWFDEFDSYENNTLQVDGFDCSVVLKEVKVDY